MATSPAAAGPLSAWELAAQTISVKIRWFGLIIGFIVVNTTGEAPNQLILNAILALGLGYAVLDTAHSFRGRVFLQRYPLLISLLEAVFIALLCYFHKGLESPFRYYYFLSLLCCAVRHVPLVTYTTCAFHCASYIMLYFALPHDARDAQSLFLMLVILAWLTWASNALAYLLKRIGEHLANLNEALRQNQSQLEERIRQRTLELQEAQALLLHQEKMAAFGLFAAGIAHEVGNPLTSISSLVQILQRRNNDPYTQEKLTLVNGQLRRIQGTLRELVNFSRPASVERTHVALHDIIAEALNVAKYYKGTRQRRIRTEFAPDVPAVLGRRDILVQVVLNLLLNAIDATERDGRITLRTEARDGVAVLAVEDEGCGMTPEQSAKVFEPYFTTKPHGTGLGLYVTRKLVAEHGGEIDFTTSPGAGTTFRVRLPAAAPAHAQRTLTASAAAALAAG